MILKQIYNINPEDITDVYDVFIGVAGIEPRSYHLLMDKTFANIAEKYYVIPYDGSPNFPPDYPKGKVEVVENAHLLDNPIWGIVEDFLIKKPQKLKIVIDYSSMTRVWYGSFLKSCQDYQGKCTLEILFAYNMAEPESPSSKMDFDFSSMPGYLHINRPNKPVALIIGLGYEDGRAYSLKDYFDAEVIYLFRTSKSWSEQYYQLVGKNNEHLLDRLPDDKVIEYSLDDVSAAYKKLEDLCYDLEQKYRIIIAPCGPKPFTLITLLTFLRHKSVNVWRIKNIGDTPPKRPSDRTIFTSIIFK